MQIKRLFLICIAVLFLQQTVHSKQTFLERFNQAKRGKTGYYFWPIFFGGGTFLVSNESELQMPGYVFSGGLTISMYKGDLFFFGDALYSYRAYDGIPPHTLDYRIEETTTDLAAGIGLENFYIGGYAQFPLNTKLNVSEWTMEDFYGLSRSPSFSLMGGVRTTMKHMGIDLRVLIGQGPGQFLSKSLGPHWLSQVSIGIMGGF